MLSLGNLNSRERVFQLVKFSPVAHGAVVSDADEIWTFCENDYLRLLKLSSVGIRQVGVTLKRSGFVILFFQVAPRMALRFLV